MADPARKWSPAEKQWDFLLNPENPVKIGLKILDPASFCPVSGWLTQGCIRFCTKSYAVKKKCFCIRWHILIPGAIWRLMEYFETSREVGGYRKFLNIDPFDMIFFFKIIYFSCRIRLLQWKTHQRRCKDLISFLNFDLWDIALYLPMNN